MKLKLFNTLGREKQEFNPINEKQVGIYTCGPTVYGKPHIGNLRAYIFASTLRNIIENILGIKVKHVVNITDVGHLTDDGDNGEDKLEKASKQEKKTAYDIAKEYENIFYDYLKKLNIKFDIHPRATEHIQEQIDLVKKLEEKGYTYIIENDGVYMDTSKVKDYGKLLPKGHIEGLLACARVQNEKKKNKTDFALWKFSPKNEKRQMEWDSPWGKGFPGWHIECSAMSCKYLGESFDIHTGGIDHIPVHHTDEIAQSESAFGHKWVNYWLHNEFLNLKNGKMSKSLGNVITLDNIIEKGFNPLVFKYFIFTAHYRSMQDFSWEDLKASEKAYNNLKNRISGLIQDFQDKRNVDGFRDGIGTEDKRNVDGFRDGISLEEGREKKILNDCHVIKDLSLEDVQRIYKEKLAGWELIDYLLDDIDTVKLIAGINKIVKNMDRFKDGIGTEEKKNIDGLENKIAGFKQDLQYKNENKDGLKKGIADKIMILSLIKYIDDKILKLDLFKKEEKKEIEIPEEIKKLAKERYQAKKEKNYDLADKLRDEIQAKGYKILDKKDGYEIKAV